jgi:hypothetical protein
MSKSKKKTGKRPNQYNESKGTSLIIRICAFILVVMTIVGIFSGFFL